MLEEIVRRLITIFSVALRVGFILLPFAICLGVGYYVAQLFRIHSLPWWAHLLGAVLFLSYAPQIGKSIKHILFWWKDESENK